MGVHQKLEIAFVGNVHIWCQECSVAEVIENVSFPSQSDLFYLICK